MRQSFLPGFDDDLPFVLVDVELDEQADLRMIGRLLDGPDARAAHRRRAVVGRRSRTSPPGVSVPAFALDERHERALRRRRDRGRGRRVRAQPGAAPCADSRSARIALDTARRAIADAGLDVAQIDGFTTGALFPTAGAHTIEDGVSIVTSNWLAEHLGVNPRCARGFQGYGQIPGVGVDGGERGRERRGRLRADAPRAAQPGRAVPRATRCAKRRGSTQWTAPQGYFGPLAMIALPYNEYLQRYGARREAMAAVLVEARKNGARIPWSVLARASPLTAEDYLDARDDRRSDLHVRLRHPGRRGGGVRLHVGRARPGPPASTGAT